MKHSVIQYTVKKGHIHENEELIKAVFAQLQAQQPPGIEYAVYKTGNSAFTHMIALDSDESSAAFTKMPAFKAFRAALKERIEAPPSRTDVNKIGHYKPNH